MPSWDSYDFIRFEGYDYTVEFLEDAPGVYFRVDGETTAPDGMSEESTHEITKGLYWYLKSWASYTLMFARDTAYETSSCKITAYKENKGSSDTIKYQWNTAPFTSLSIGATLDNVDVKAPTKDKILTLNTQTRNITLPVGYNTTIATQGDVGTAFVYIQCPRYIAGLDLTNIEVKKYLGWSAGEKSGINECSITKIYSEVEKDDLVMLTWDVDENLTCDYAGNFSFELSFKKFTADGVTLEKQWYSNSNSSLLIKATLGIDGDTIPTSGEVGVIVEATIIPVVDEEELDSLIEAELK
jgi:hypothetical protein